MKLLFRYCLWGLECCCLLAAGGLFWTALLSHELECKASVYLVPNADQVKGRDQHVELVVIVVFLNRQQSLTLDELYSGA